MKYILQTKDLTKEYSHKRAVDNVSLAVRQGDIYGFVGKNGAGKTTFIRMILGLTRVTSGSYSFFEGDSSQDHRRRIGSLVEKPSLYKNMTAKDNLDMYSIMIGADKAETGRLLDLVGLSDTGKKRVADFSLGMKQRLGIAMALVGDPELLILDEPINGLDPKGIAEIRELFLKLKNNGKTIFISSHILGELEKIASCYGIISAGRLVEEITSEQLHSMSIERTIIRADRPEDAMAVAKKLLGADKMKIEYGRLYITGSVPNIGELTNEMFKQGITVTGITNDNGGAEEYFLKKMEEGQS